MSDAAVKMICDLIAECFWPCWWLTLGIAVIKYLGRGE